MSLGWILRKQISLELPMETWQPTQDQSLLLRYPGVELLAVFDDLVSDDAVMDTGLERSPKCPKISLTRNPKFLDLSPRRKMEDFNLEFVRMELAIHRQELNTMWANASKNLSELVATSIHVELQRLIPEADTEHYPRDGSRKVCVDGRYIMCGSGSENQSTSEGCQYDQHEKRENQSWHGHTASHERPLDHGGGSRQREIQDLFAARAFSARSYLTDSGKALEQRSTRDNIRIYLHSSVCEYLITLLIVVNAVIFGLQAEFSIAHPHDEPPEYFEIAEWFFTAAFTVELCIRFIGHGIQLLSCSNPDVNWNWLDCGLVASSYVEVFLKLAKAPNISSARLVRMLRLVRIVRALRVMRFFKVMRVMVMSILSSLNSLMWALLLLALIIYMFAVLLLQLIQDDLAALSAVPHFTSFLRLMYTLFCCISGGLSWIEVVDSIKHINPAISPLFALYIVFSVFCVLNIVTGVFVEQAAQMTQTDEEFMLMNEIDKRKEWINGIENVFNHADKDGSGELSFREFFGTLTDVRVETALKKCGIDLNRTDVKSIWNLLDFDGTGRIPIEEFTSGLQHMQGEATSLDVAKLNHEVKKIQRMVHKLDNIERTLEKVSAASMGQPLAVPIRRRALYAAPAMTAPREELTTMI